MLAPVGGLGHARTDALPAESSPRVPSGAVADPGATSAQHGAAVGTEKRPVDATGRHAPTWGHTTGNRAGELNHGGAPR